MKETLIDLTSKPGLSTEPKLQEVGYIRTFVMVKVLPEGKYFHKWMLKNTETAVIYTVQHQASLND